MSNLYLVPLAAGSVLFLGAMCTTPQPQTNVTTNSVTSSSTTANTQTVAPNRTFVSSNLDYTISYPNSWYSWSGSDVYAEFDSKETDIDYLSTEDRVTGSDISGEGVSLAITYTSKIDPATGQALTFEAVVAKEMVPSVASEKETLTIGGLSTLKQVETDPRDPDNEFGYVVTYYVDAPGGVYVISSTSTSEVEYNRQAATILAIVSSFTLSV